MAQEVESYLMERFSEGLKSPDVILKRDLQELKSSIEAKLQTPSASEMPLLREKLYRLNNLLAECQTVSFLSGEGLVSWWRIRQNLKGIKEELKRLDSSASTGNGNPPQNLQQSPQSASASNGNRNPPQSGQRNSSSAKQSQVYGFDDEIMSLVKMLVYEGRNDKFKAVGITGMAGTGKTTLCQELLKREEVKNCFIPRILVSMSEKPDGDKDVKIALVERMLKSLGVEEKIIGSISSRGLAALLCALHVQLMGKKYLIVLDDAQDIDEWYQNLTSPFPCDIKWEERLAYGLPKGHGGTIIVTSRKDDSAKKMVEEKKLHCLLPLADEERRFNIFKDDLTKKMVEQKKMHSLLPFEYEEKCRFKFEDDLKRKITEEKKIHCLMPLADEEKCWLIFKDVVEQDGTPYNPSNVELEDLKREVIQKCGGLPLAAKVMGEIMKETLKEGPVLNGHIVTVQPQLPARSNSNV